MSLQQQLNIVAGQIQQKAPPEALNIIEQENNALANAFSLDNVIQVGDLLPSFKLYDEHGKEVFSESLLHKQPVIITFYRGEWCPFCNVTLTALNDALPEIQAAGATLIAISPQLPAQTKSTKDNHAPNLKLLSDRQNKFAKQLGLVFKLSESLQSIYASFGIDLANSNGDATFELPLAATFLVDASGKVLERFVETDYRKRVETETIIGWLKKHD